MLYSLILLAAAVVAATTTMWNQAVRDEHVVSFRTRKGARFLLELDRDGRYRNIQPSQTPAAVARYTSGRMTVAFRLLRVRLRGRHRLRVSSPAHSQ